MNIPKPEADNRDNFEKHLSKINVLLCGHRQRDYKQMRNGDLYFMYGMEQSALIDAWKLWQAAIASYKSNESKKYDR
jgi:hypothetical protein